MKQYEIVRFGVWSVAKLWAVFGAMMGFLGGVMFSVISVVEKMPSDAMPPSARFLQGLFFSKYAVLTLPLFYAISTAAFGALGAFSYNLTAQWVGGIRFKVEPAPQKEI